MGESAIDGKKEIFAVNIIFLVCFHSLTLKTKQQVQIYFAGKSRYIGVYKSKKSATIAFEKAREIAEQTPNLTNERQVNLNLKEIRYLVSEDIAKQSQHGELTRRRSGRSRKADNDEAVEVDDVAGKETRRNSARRALQNTSDLDEFVPVNDEDGADISRRTSRRSKAPPKKLLSSGDIEGSIEESVQTDGRRVKRSSAKTTSLGSVRPKKDSRERDEEPELITDPGPNDLLLGRGGYCKHHPGNIKYREFIRSNKRAYLSNPDKSAFAIAAVAKWRSLGMKESGSAGKFLKQAYGENAEEEVWVDAGDEYAKDKTMQAFRDSDSGTARKEYRINMNGEEEDEDDEVVEPQLKQSTRRRQSKLTSHSEECTQTLRSSPSSVVTPDFTPSSRPTRRYNIQNDSGVTIAEAAASGCNRCRQLLNGVKSKDRHASNCPRKRVGAKNKTSDKDSAGKAKTTKGKTGRGRGRPPKIVGPDTSPIATRRRGRPRLDRCIPVTKPTYDENFDVGGPTKRKVGRPRKELKRSAADLLDERCDGKKQRTGDALSSDDDDKERPTLNKRWSNAEKTQFEQGVIVHGWGEWKKIGHYVKTRNKKQISGYAAKMTLNNPGEKERMLQLHNNNLEDEEMRGGVEKEMIFRAAGVDWTAMKSFRAGHRPWTEDEKQMFATACINEGKLSEVRRTLQRNYLTVCVHNSCEGWGKWHRVEGEFPKAKAALLNNSPLTPPCQATFRLGRRGRLSPTLTICKMNAPRKSSASLPRTMSFISYPTRSQYNAKRIFQRTYLLTREAPTRATTTKSLTILEVTRPLRNASIQAASITDTMKTMARQTIPCAATKSRRRPRWSSLFAAAVRSTPLALKQMYHMQGRKSQTRPRRRWPRSAPAVKSSKFRSLTRWTRIRPR